MSKSINQIHLEVHLSSIDEMIQEAEETLKDSHSKYIAYKTWLMIISKQCKKTQNENTNIIQN